MTKEGAINILIKDCHSDKISDGHHTFGELYEHRNMLFVKLCKMVHETNKLPVWRTIKGSDGLIHKGWFILGISKIPQTQISYHLPIELWDQVKFAETLDISPYDGHTSKDVVQRLNTQL